MAWAGQGIGSGLPSEGTPSAATKETGSIETPITSNDSTSPPVDTLRNAAGAVLEINEEQNGGMVAMIVYDMLTIRIEGNPTTGFVWEPDNVDGGLIEPVGEPKYSPNNHLRGGSGTFSFTFQARKAGVAPLRLIYHRRFEKNVPPARTFHVTVDIQEP